MRQVDPHAVTVEEPFQCVLCDFKIGSMPADGHCPKCGAPNVRNVEATDGIYDNALPEQVAHFTKGVTMCWNQKRLDNGTFATHPFVEKMVPAVHLSNQ